MPDHTESEAPRQKPEHIKRIRSATRTAGRVVGNLTPFSSAEAKPEYPHDTHPALVPGIGVDEQRRRYSLDKLIFAVAGLLTVAFVIWGVTSPESVANISGVVFDWTITNTGWIFGVLATVILFFMLFIACSKYGKITLGKDGEEPEFSNFSWAAMLFAAGLGVGVFFFGPSEPLTFFLDPPPHTNEAESVEALHGGMAQAYFHWGFHAWAIYALVGSAIAYVAYRRGRVPLLSSVFRTLFGNRHSEGLAGQMVDIFAIVATLFGTAASLGLAAMQIAEGATVVFGIEITNPVIVLIISGLACAFIVSAISGVSRGIRYLSNINIIATLGVVGAIFILGPTLFLLNLLPSAAIEYTGSMFDMMGRSASWGEETAEFQSWWTVFFWAWWISWSPFVGIFIARISRGRTLRGFILGVILIPTSLLVVCFGILGGTAIHLHRTGEADFSESTEPEVLFGILESIPGLEWAPLLVMVVLAIFFITAADSAAAVMGIMSTRGNLNPKKPVVVFWGLVMAGVATVMILTGGDVALEGLQNLLTATALPFTLVLGLIMVALVKELRTDPQAMRDIYAEQAIADAVVEGVDKHGDDFQLKVEASEPGEGAGRDVPSDNDAYTEWYQRTDEDENPIDYNYETDSWGDGYDPATGSIKVVDKDD